MKYILPVTLFITVVLAGLCLTHLIYGQIAPPPRIPHLAPIGEQVFVDLKEQRFVVTRGTYDNHINFYVHRAVLRYVTLKDLPYLQLPFEVFNATYDAEVYGPYIEPYCMDVADICVEIVELE